MTAFTAKRTLDNLLYVADESPAAPDEAAVVANAVRALGGVAGDWVFQALTEAQYSAMLGQQGRAYLSGESIVLKEITLTSSAPTVVADGVTTVTLTANTSTPGYTGNIKFTVTAPDGTSATETVAAVAGVASTTMDTEQVGVHTVVAECIEFGVKQITVEGV